MLSLFLVFHQAEGSALRLRACARLTASGASVLHGVLLCPWGVLCVRTFWGGRLSVGPRAVWRLFTATVTVTATHWNSCGPNEFRRPSRFRPADDRPTDGPAALLTTSDSTCISNAATAHVTSGWRMRCSAVVSDRLRRVLRQALLAITGTSGPTWVGTLTCWTSCSTGECIVHC